MYKNSISFSFFEWIRASDLHKCLTEPVEPDSSYFAFCLVMLILLAVNTILEKFHSFIKIKLTFITSYIRIKKLNLIAPYISRLRRFICAYCYPSRERARIHWLRMSVRLLFEDNLFWNFTNRKPYTTKYGTPAIYATTKYT